MKLSLKSLTAGILMVFVVAPLTGCGPDAQSTTIDPNKNPNYVPGPEDGKAKDTKGGFVPDLDVERIPQNK